MLHCVDYDGSVFYIRDSVTKKVELYNLDKILSTKCEIYGIKVLAKDISAVPYFYKGYRKAVSLDTIQVLFRVSGDEDEIKYIMLHGMLDICIVNKRLQRFNIGSIQKDFILDLESFSSVKENFITATGYPEYKLTIKLKNDCSVSYNKLISSDIVCGPKFIYSQIELDFCNIPDEEYKKYVERMCVYADMDLKVTDSYKIERLYSFILDSALNGSYAVCFTKYFKAVYMFMDSYNPTVLEKYCLEDIPTRFKVSLSADKGCIAIFDSLFLTWSEIRGSEKPRSYLVNNILAVCGFSTQFLCFLLDVDLAIDLISKMVDTCYEIYKECYH